MSSDKKVYTFALSQVDATEKNGIEDAITKRRFSLRLEGGELILSVVTGTKEGTEKALIEDIEALVERHGTPMKRKYTKRKDWNNPDLPKDHPANRTDALFSSRIDSETNELVREFLEAHSGMTKKELTTKALRRYIEENTPGLDQ